MDDFRYDPSGDLHYQWETVVGPRMSDLDEWFDVLHGSVEAGWFQRETPRALSDWIERWKGFPRRPDCRYPQASINWEAVRSLADLANLASRVSRPGDVAAAYEALRAGTPADDFRRLVREHGEDWVRVGVRSLLEEPQREVEVYVALAETSDSAGVHGLVAKLILGYFVNGNGCVAPDPRGLGTTFLSNFKAAIAETFRLARNANGAPPVDGRWRLRDVPAGVRSVDGPSAGGAAYRGWYDCVGNRFPDDGVIVLAEADGHGQAIGVGYVAQKVEAVVAADLGIDTIVVIEDNLTDALDAVRATSRIDPAVDTPSPGLHCIRLA